jgi:predicted component of type VI protein secretion system
MFKYNEVNDYYQVIIMENEPEQTSNPDVTQPETASKAVPEVTTQPVSAEDASKAKAKGGFFGDPIFIVE